MVYPVSIKIFRHLAETLFPPSETIFRHFFPIICREAPVLSEHRKIIRRSSGLTIHIEKPRILPCVNTETTYADWNVAFEHHFMLMGIITNLTKLTIQMILHKIMELYPVFIIFAEIRHFIGFIFCIITPKCVVRSLEFLA